MGIIRVDGEEGRRRAALRGARRFQYTARRRRRVRVVMVMMMMVMMMMRMVVGRDSLLVRQEQQPLPLGGPQGIQRGRWRVAQIRLAGRCRRRTAGRLALAASLMRVALLDVDGGGGTLLTRGCLATGTGYRRGRVLLLLVGACHCTSTAPALR